MSHTITRLGHLGEGIAEGPIYIPRALPGEVVEGEVDSGRIAAPRILTPSPDRVRAPCPHYKGCGGCALMHASDSFVADWKTDVVRRALTAQGIDAPLRPIETSPSGTRRRATFSGRRLKSSVLVGFHGRASHSVVAVPNCAVLHPDLTAALPVCEAIVKGFGSRRGTLRLATTRSDAGIDLDVTDERALDGTDHVTLAGLAEAHDLARLSWNGEVVVERRPPVQRFDEIEVVPPPGAFLQATRHGEDTLRAAVVEAIGPAKSVVDLFAGCGTFALPLARRARVHAVEAGSDMLSAADRAWRKASGLRDLSTETRDLFRRPLLPDELAHYDAVVIDPPRAGAEAQMREIVEANIPRIAAVSCNPVSFARDAKLLIDGGYRLDWVQIVDQFRWSPHIELAAAFRRDHIASD
ncbi:MAG: class I SAM-dependent RNA methyltransferase [Rhodobacteraceae bacterium]|nr:class I SAM-dependent RNA methyltransferase [Paracoccaceae bacterium]